MNTFNQEFKLEDLFFLSQQTRVEVAVPLMALVNAFNQLPGLLIRKVNRIGVEFEKENKSLAEKQTECSIITAFCDYIVENLTNVGSAETVAERFTTFLEELYPDALLTDNQKKLVHVYLY